MKKQHWLLSILFLFTTALTGCGVAGLETEAEHLEPINLVAWPTPEPAAPAVSPTPFPQVTLVAAATPTSLAVTTTTATPAPMTEVSPADTAVAQVKGGLYAPVAAVFVTVDNATIYRRPGQAAVGTIEKGELAGVLGQNVGGDWLYVLTPAQVQGWLPKTSLHITGTLEKAPVLPPDPLAAIAPTPADPPAGVSTNTPPVALADLKPIATAQVTSAGLNLRQGPGVAYHRLGTLARNDRVSILAVNPRKDWALVATSTGQQGWVSLAFVKVQGDMSKAPVVAADQLAPATAIPRSSATAMSQAEPVSFKSNPTHETPYSHLAAHIARNEIYVRPGPNAEYAGIDKLTDNQEQLTVLALDQSRNWALVQPAFSHTGWVALAELTVEGAVADAPQVLTAWVISNAVDVRSGPGIFHDPTGQLAINNLVRLWGLDDGRSWALIQPLPGGSLGWTQIQFLKNVGQPWANVPTVKNEGGGMKDEEEIPIVNYRPPTPNPHIVFQRSSGGDIMVIKPDGRGLHRLTSGLDPVLSPDGQTVAFTRWEGESGSLWLIGIDGSHKRPVLGFIKQAKGPDWSPDGSQIVLNFQHGGRLGPKTECFDLAKAPHPPRNATGIGSRLNGDSEPELCWKLPPDPHWGLRVVNLADGSFEDVDGGTYAFRPAWDPAQPWRIVSDGGRGLLAADLNRDYRQNLTEEVNDGSPVFSPDGRYITVTTGKEGGDSGFNLYRLNADGSGRVQLTETPLWVPVQPDAPKAWNNVAPAWSPDAAQIAFLTDRSGRWEIWVMNADGSNQRPLFSDEVNAQLHLTYHFVDERVLSWR
jgi:uncharacterized protein YgiM (DUF1202 family)